MPNKTNPSFWCGFLAGVVVLGVVVMTVTSVTSKNQASEIIPFFSDGAVLYEAEDAKIVLYSKAPKEKAAAPGALKKIRKETKPGTAPYLGPFKAKLVIHAFADFHCEFCAKQAPVLEQIAEAYPGKVKIKFQHFPLSEASYLPHEAALCAQDQKRFWDFHDELFARQPADKQAVYQIARDLSLDLDQFFTCLKSEEHRETLETAIKFAETRRVAGTPSLRIRKNTTDGFQDFAALKKLVDKELGIKESKTKTKSSKSQEFKYRDFLKRPYQGPADAKVTMVEYSDFHCPFCQRVSPTLDQLMTAFPGQIRRGFRHFPLAFHPEAKLAHEASECAAEQGKFWEFKEAIFKDVPQSKSKDGLIAMADDLGLKVKQFTQCVETGKYRKVVEEDMEMGGIVGVSGTPATFLNGEHFSGALSFEHFKAGVEGILDPSKKIPAVKPKPSPPAIKKEINLADLSGRPFRGDKNAPITLVEFSDFHCPFCQRVTPTLNDLLKNYSGKVKLVWQHFPLPIHPQAQLAHVAAECAHEQGKFWEFHDEIFGNSSAVRTKEELMSFAKSLGLKKRKFSKCLAVGDAEGIVTQDIARGKKLGVGGTPAVFVNGRLVSGARPYKYFKNIVDEELKQK